MKIRFVIEGQGMFEGEEKLIAEFDVETPLTEQESRLIYSEINKQTEELENCEITMDEWKNICKNACKKHITILNNPCVKTFYIN